MSGHRHNPNAGTQNQGNSLGDRSCVRQSKLYRMYESGNDVKAILGSGHLAWDPNYKQGAYAGQKVFDHEDNGSHTYGNRSNSNISASNSNYGRNNDENRYPPKNTLSHYARDDDYSYQQPKRSGGAVPSYDDDYAPRAAVGGRGNSSGGGPSSFMIGQTDYSGGRGDDSRSNYHRRTSNEPTASGNDTYPMNKMGTSARATEDYRRAPVEESSYPLNKMNGGGGSSGGYRRGVRDEDENEGDNYPLSKMNQSGSGYRNAKEQMNYNSSNSNFQPARGGSGGKSSEIVARSYFPPQQPQSDRDRSTRPW